MYAEALVIGKQFAKERDPLVGLTKHARREKRQLTKPSEDVVAQPEGASCRKAIIREASSCALFRA